MQAAIGNLSRIVSRSLVSGVVERVDTISTKTQVAAGSPSTTGTPEGVIGSSQQSQSHHELTTAVSGFPKSKNGHYSIESILKGQIGDDAYFITRHVDDWNNNDSNEGSKECANKLLNPSNISGSTGSSFDITYSDSSDSANHIQSNARLRNNTADVIGVADGVGGWRAYGVDPGLFSMNLMKSCERLVKAGYFVNDQPAKLLKSGFLEMQQSKRPIIGSSTACVAILNHADGKLYTANIGDSGFLVFRGGRVVHRSQEQQHYFNTPFQLSLPPSHLATEVLSDAPESADRYEFSVEHGDVILLATDGIFDNIPDSVLVKEVGSLQRGHQAPDPAEIQACANSIALIARKLSQDESFLSPFAKNARSNGFANVVGGKEDDVTVILAAVSLNSNQKALQDQT